MSSNVPPTIVSSKTANASSYPSSNSSTQLQSANVADSVPQRRSGGSGSFGAGSSTRSTPQGRNNQPVRKQHKAQRRPRLADEDAIAESAAMKSINSRKGQTSITHLMNFSLPPRPYLQQQYHHSSQHRHQRRNPTWGLGSGYHAVDKARYVHANYRFIVKPDRTYHAQAADPDVHLDWDTILQILASAETQLASCPICLSTPVAPRMARCGHIFCLPCLIRYMHSTDETDFPEKRARWKKCPICEDSIYISETRPVRWFLGQEVTMLREGGDVLLKLLTREPGSTLALPRELGERHGSQEDIPWYHAAEMMDYARIMKGGEDYMVSQYDEEVKDLEAQEKEDELMFGDDTKWTKKAVAAISDAKQKLSGIGNPPGRPKQPSQRRMLRPSDDCMSSEEPPKNGAARRGPVSSEEHDHIGTTTSTSGGPSTLLEFSYITMDLQKLSTAANALSIADDHEESHFHTRATSSADQPFDLRATGSSFFYYNALPNFYLSPLDIRILKAAFGTFSSFPSTILPRVEHISTGHMVDDDLRKRAKYLAHLPYGCEVSFLECDWNDVIAPSVLIQFDADIGRRRKKHHEKEAREERDRIRAEKEEEDKRWAAARRRRPGVVEKSFSETDFQPLTQLDESTGMSSNGSHSISTTPPWGARTHSSFATLGSPGTSPDAPRTVWGTAIIPPNTPPSMATPQDGPVPDDGWLQGWEKDLLDDDDAMALVEAATSQEGSSRTGSTATGKQKKKNKKITLMSTNARRGA